MVRKIAGLRTSKYSTLTLLLKIVRLAVRAKVITVNWCLFLLLWISGILKKEWMLRGPMQPLIGLFLMILGIPIGPYITGLTRIRETDLCSMLIWDTILPNGLMFTSKRDQICTIQNLNVKFIPVVLLKTSMKLGKTGRSKIILSPV